ncbi:unnamed protein product [Sphagnum jensenii]|uniref:Uncharacterized protein n=1 Tax=Sphagnum jensenii TaxID=128206 RepID=A0ABP0V8E1_9BRYO
MKGRLGLRCAPVPQVMSASSVNLVLLAINTILRAVEALVNVLHAIATVTQNIVIPTQVFMEMHYKALKVIASPVRVHNKGLALYYQMNQWLVFNVQKVMQDISATFALMDILVIQKEDLAQLLRVINDAVNDHRTKLSELTHLLEEIERNPQVVDDLNFERQLQEVSNKVSRLLDDARRAQGSDGS